jgi:SAM-dependent methyltransferase
MSERDREKWDRKYNEMAELLEERPPSEMVTLFYSETGGRKALDLACGNGRHTLFLARHGFHIDAVDISATALKSLGKKINKDKVTIIEADLDTFKPGIGTYDLIVMTNYLDRTLIERAKSALKPGGLFIVETYMRDPRNEKKDSNPDFLLQEKELPEHFGEEYQILQYREFWNEPDEMYHMKKQAIVVKKEG